MDIVIRNLPKDTEQRIKQYCKDKKAYDDVLIIDAVEKYITQKSGDDSSDDFVKKVLKLRLGASDDFSAYAGIIAAAPYLLEAVEEALKIGNNSKRAGKSR